MTNEEFARSLFDHGMTHPHGSKERKLMVHASSLLLEQLGKASETPAAPVSGPVSPAAASVVASEPGRPQIVIQIADDERPADAVRRHFDMKLMPWQSSHINKLDPGGR